MSDEFKLDINIPQKKIEIMAKQVIREIINEKIEKAMENINIVKIINDKLNTIDPKLSKIMKDAIMGQINELAYTTRNQLNKSIREVVLAEVQKKPLSGNVYLKIGDGDIRTDYDDY